MGGRSCRARNLVDERNSTSPAAAQLYARRFSPESPMNSRRGFTLIELMISITLVAAISAGILMAMRTGLQSMQKVNDRLASNRRVLTVQQILQHQLSNAMPVMGLCDAGNNVF